MIIEDHITQEELAQDILRFELLKHRDGECDCQEQAGIVYPCIANEWLKGIVPSKHIVENHFEKRG